MRHRLLIVMLCAGACANSQEPAGTAGQIPPHLRLKGDPAAGLDLGSMRFVPMGRRPSPHSPVTGAPYVCRESLLKKQQVPPDGLKLSETLLGRPVSAVLPYLNKLSPEKRAHIISTHHCSLVGLLGKGSSGGVTSEEWVRLGTFFRELAKKPRELNGIQRTHLWAIRLLQAEAALADLLDLDREGRLKPGEGGARPVAHGRFEVYLFDSASEHDAFCKHIFQAETEPLVGELIQNVPVPVPASAILMAGGTQQEKLQRFVFSASLLSLTRHRRRSGGLPPWLMLGVAHFMESRHKHQKKPRLGARTLPGTPEGIKNWDAVVRDMVIARKTADILSLTAAGHESMTVPMRVQACSMVRFMVGASPGRFSKMVRLLYGAGDERSRILAINDAVRLSYEVELRTLEKAWRLWAGRKR